MSAKNYHTIINNMLSGHYYKAILVKESRLITNDGILPFECDTVTLLCTNPNEDNAKYFVHKSSRIFAISEIFRILSRDKIIAKKSDKIGYVKILCVS